MKFNKYLLALVTCLTMAQHASWAEDIDIYGGATSNASPHIYCRSWFHAAASSW